MDSEKINQIQEYIDFLDIKIQKENRLIKLCNDSKKILIDLDKEFEHRTQLNKIDTTFLFFAVALQCTRQYILDKVSERVDHNEAAKKTKHTEEHSNRSHRLYNPSLDEIITNPVPFDTNFGSKEFDLGIGGGFVHRLKTLGHDPLLGWIFGTANIATSTLTTNKLESYHVKTGNTANGRARDKIINKASTSKVLFYTKEKLLNEGLEGKKIIGGALCKEAIHLKSDIGSKVSLPIPCISLISPDIAYDLASYGIDMGSVSVIGKQAIYAELINSIIAMIHSLFYFTDRSIDKKLYIVKTKKIIMLSNVIASTSNIVKTAIGFESNGVNALRKIDIGGIAVTIYRLMTDMKFINKVKEEFIFNNFDQMIMNV